MPAHVKVMMFGVISYFVMPVYRILDIFPGGYHDDLLAVVVAISVAEKYINYDVRWKAIDKAMEIIEEIE